MVADHSWYACKEHIELVIDDYVDQYQRAPEIEPVENTAQTGARCRQCGGTPAYRFTRFDGE
ncbi:CxxH/CxxC protein [Desmospora activa]|nr:CxxH/CxxC protein [Desmospora activa]